MTLSRRIAFGQQTAAYRCAGRAPVARCTTGEDITMRLLTQNEVLTNDIKDLNNDIKDVYQQLTAEAKEKSNLYQQLIAEAKEKSKLQRRLDRAIKRKLFLEEQLNLRGAAEEAARTITGDEKSTMTKVIIDSCHNEDVQATLKCVAKISGCLACNISSIVKQLPHNLSNWHHQGNVGVWILDPKASSENSLFSSPERAALLALFVVAGFQYELVDEYGKQVEDDPYQECAPTVALPAQGQDSHVV